MLLYAHTKGEDQRDWEALGDHLRDVAELSETFGAAFGAGPLAAAAGWWHDLGKASEDFQAKVLGAGGDEADFDTADGNDFADRPASRARVDHSTAGARYAVESLGPVYGSLIAYGILGHHGRLPDHHRKASQATYKTRLDARVYTRVPKVAELPREAVEAVDPQRCWGALAFDPGGDEDLLRPFRCGMLTRMLYSVLIDADRLATERFCDRPRANLRSRETPTPGHLLKKLNAALDQLQTDRTNDPAPVDGHRREVLSACRARAADPPGHFSLTVPTGGGKTLASMAFALGHAERHGLRRVVIALPYTSIIEQTAETLGKVFGTEHVLEHHSNLNTDRLDRRSLALEMAAENWDAPVIVTTNNQLFESLFSAHGSTCRKLHRLARSVIVLDEAQSIPPRLLRPTLAVLDELVRNYGCSVVFCTATQPAILRRPDFAIGLDPVTEIVPDPATLFTAMKRVDVDRLGSMEDETLADRLAAHERVLCIVNTKKHAAALTQALQARVDDADAVMHLSAAMCPQHRSERVATIKDRLKNKLPIRVVSTQVIEAGVDVDFPVVYRALAGFDSIAQAAGRCNREGRAKRGQVHVFDTGQAPPRSLRAGYDVALDLIDAHPDPMTPQAIRAFFERYYWRRSHEGKKPWDAEDVMGCFETEAIHQFRLADERFRWIDSATTAVVVPHGQRGQNLVQHLRDADELDWQLLRGMQRYCVSVYEHQLQQLQDQTTVMPCFDGRFWVLNNPEAYDDLLGLRLDADGIGTENLTSS
jgi:CRISPR-associated endonuclease/helicase Cas3